MPRMPPRKEPKEAVVYEMSSKRKAPPFKPQRPSKVPRVSTTGSESSTAKSVKRPAATTVRKPARPQPFEDDEDDEEETVAKGPGKPAQQIIRSSGIISDSEEELASDPLATKPKLVTKKKPPISTAAALMKPLPPLPKRKPSARQPSPEAISDNASPSPPANRAPSPSHSSAPPEPSLSTDVPSIPQPLLIRLLHEHFQDKTTKIDKHAVQVVQKYMEIFVREAIARTALAKAEKTERGETPAEDRGWLELADLQGVAAGMLLDF